MGKIGCLPSHGVRRWCGVGRGHCGYEMVCDGGITGRYVCGFCVVLGWCVVESRGILVMCGVPVRWNIL